MYVCICNKITDSDIRNALDQGACSLECLQSQLNVATCCGRCKDCANRLIHESFNSQITADNQAVA